MNIFTKIGKFFRPQSAVKSNEFLRLVEVVDLEACDGKVDESLIDRVFRWTSLQFRELMVVAGLATPRTKIAVYEIIKDGQFADIFGSLSGNFNDLRLTQAQIVKFCKNYPRSLNQMDGTFLPFIGNCKNFVAGVGVRSGGLNVAVYCLEDDYVWSGESRDRVVVPQF
jgi:hypothetical protein